MGKHKQTKVEVENTQKEKDKQPDRQRELGYYDDDDERAMTP